MARRRGGSRLRSPLRSPVKPRARRRRPRPNGVAVVWLLVGSLFMLAAVLVQSLTAIIVCVSASLCSAALGSAAMYHPEKLGIVPARRARTRKPRTTAKRASTDAARSKPGTARPVGSGVPCGCRAGTRCPGVGRCRCARCRNVARATKSRPAAGKKPAAVGPRWSSNDDGGAAWLRSREAKRIERRLVREQKRRDGGRA